MKFKHKFRLSYADDHTRIYSCGKIRMRIDFIKGMFRVALIRNAELLPTFSIDPDHKRLNNEGRDKLSLEGFKLCAPKIHEDEENVRFRHAGNDFRIELMNFRITISNDKGVLYQDRSGLAYNFAGELGEGSIHYTVREEDQFIYGLGDKAGGVNKNHQHYKLDTNDAMGFKAQYSDPLYKYLPFYICETVPALMASIMIPTVKVKWISAENTTITMNTSIRSAMKKMIWSSISFSEMSKR